MDGFVEVKTTTGSKEEAEMLGREALLARLAACAQVTGPVSSTYWWNGTIEHAEEWMCVLKAPSRNFEEIARLLSLKHSYETPEIIATPVSQGSAPYLSWVAEEASG